MCLKWTIHGNMEVEGVSSGVSEAERGHADMPLDTGRTLVTPVMQWLGPGWQCSCIQCL